MSGFDVAAIGSFAGDLASAYGSYRAGTEAAKSAERINEANRAQAEEFAKHGVQWRVEDAKAAGLHPLYAVGANISAQPAQTVGSDYSYLGHMGQDIGRAIKAVTTPEQTEMQKLQVDEMKSRIAENEARTMLLNSQRSRLEQTPTPGIPASNTITAPFGTLKTSPTTKSQTVEDEYGDIAQEIYGTSRMINDLGMNFWDAVKRQNPWWLKSWNWLGQQRDKAIRNDPSTYYNLQKKGR